MSIWGKSKSAAKFVFVKIPAGILGVNTLRSNHQTTPSAAQLAELQRQISACTTRGHRIRLKVGRGLVERGGAELRWYNPTGFGPTFA